MILYTLYVIVPKALSIGCCIPLRADLPHIITCECFQQIYNLLSAVQVNKNFGTSFSF